MKKVIVLVFVLNSILNFTSKAQSVGINAHSPDNSAVLDIVSSEKGILIPRMNSTQRSDIPTPATGLLVFDSDTESFWYKAASKWIELSTTGAFQIDNGVVRKSGTQHIDDFVFGSDTLPGTDDNYPGQFFFDISKSAFRLGRQVNSFAWSPDSLGLYSVSFGQNVKAKGNYSFSQGLGADASGLVAMAQGHNAKAYGNFSLAIGNSASALTTYSQALGSNNVSDAWYATAIGSNVLANSYGVVSLGRFNIGGGTFDTWIGNEPIFEVGNGTSSAARSNAITIHKNGDFMLNNHELPGSGFTNGSFFFYDESKNAFRVGKLLASTAWEEGNLGQNSFAINSNSKASGDNSSAFNTNTTASGKNATAFNSSTTASGENSTSMGRATKANAFASFSLGQFNIGGGDPLQWVDTDPLFEVGNGPDFSSMKNALTLIKNGDFILNHHQIPVSSSPGSILFFDVSKSAFRAGFAPSNDWIGNNVGDFSFAANSNTKASGEYSFAINNNTEASGMSSFSSGISSKATGDGSAVFGSLTKASGTNTIAAGYTSEASGTYSSAFNNGTMAIGGASVAFNTLTAALGSSSSAFGRYTSAGSYASFALGRYNLGGGDASNWETSDPLFEIGIGGDDLNRLNALTLLKNGNLGIGIATSDPSHLLHINDGNPDPVKIENLALDNAVSEIVTVDPNGVFKKRTALSLDKQELTLNNNILSILGGNTVDLSGYTSNTLDEAYDQDGAGLGRALVADNGALKIEGSDGFLVTGTHGSGSTIEITGLGSRMFYNPKKSAFRAGATSNNYWDDVNVGNYSSAFGLDSKASGDQSSSFGNFSEANGNTSSAFGISTRADAYASFVIGRGNVGGGNLTVWSAADPVFEIGIGKSETLVANALTVLKNGNVGMGLLSSPTHPLHIGINGLTGNGAHLTDGGTWTNGSSRLFKENFQKILPDEILKNVRELEISSWQYKDSKEGSHLGPIAEEFYEAFKLGDNPQYISTVDADGVALAAIQALASQNEILKERIVQLELEIGTLTEVKNRLLEIEKLIADLPNK